MTSVPYTPNGVATSTTDGTAATTPVVESTPHYQRATREQQLALLDDLNDTLAAGGTQEDWYATLAEYPTAAAYLATVRPVGTSPELAAAVAALQVQAGTEATHPEMAQDAASGEAEAEEEHNPADRAEQANAQAAAEQAAQEEAAVRAQVVEDVRAMKQAYRRGEKAYALGLLGSGMYAHRVVVGKLRLGDKRKSGVQLVESTLAPWSSDAVDANRLIRCWAAHHLLGVGQGLAEPLDAGKGRKTGPADAVAYGVYRDCWSKLVDRADKDTAQEHYVLLAGLEGECRACFRDATEKGLSKDAVAEKVAQLVADHQRLEQERADRAAEEAREKAREAEEATRAERERLAAAEAERKAAEKAAREAEEAARREKDAEARKEAEGKAAAAKAAAEAKRRAEEAQRQQMEQQRREEARAKEEERKAAARQAEAEAERKRLADKAAKKAERKAGEGDRPAGEKPQPSPEARQGENLLRAAAKATPKDLGDMVKGMVQGHEDPQAALYEAVLALAAGATKALTADDVVRTVFLALDRARAAGAFHAAQVVKAIEAARLQLSRKADKAA